MFLTDWLLRCCEIVDRYHPRILYFDWWIQHSAVKPFLWQSDTSVMRNSWCYSLRGDYKQPIEILWDLIDVVSKNGRLAAG